MLKRAKWASLQQPAMAIAMITLGHTRKQRENMEKKKTKNNSRIQRKI